MTPEAGDGRWVKNRRILANLAVFPGNILLALGAGGQGVLLKSAVPVIPFGALIVMLMVPFIVMYSVTFLKGPFISANLVAGCAGFAACLFMAQTLLPEILLIAGGSTPALPEGAPTAARILMAAGCLDLPLLWCLRQELRRRT